MIVFENYKKEKPANKYGRFFLVTEAPGDEEEEYIPPRPRNAKIITVKPNNRARLDFAAGAEDLMNDPNLDNISFDLGGDGDPNDDNIPNVDNLFNNPDVNNTLNIQPDDTTTPPPEDNPEQNDIQPDMTQTTPEIGDAPTEQVPDQFFTGDVGTEEPPVQQDVTPDAGTTPPAEQPMDGPMNPEPVTPEQTAAPVDTQPDMQQPMDATIQDAGAIDQPVPQAGMEQPSADPTAATPDATVPTPDVGTDTAAPMDQPQMVDNPTGGDMTIPPATDVPAPDATAGGDVPPADPNAASGMPPADSTADPNAAPTTITPDSAGTDDMGAGDDFSAGGDMGDLGGDPNAAGGDMGAGTDPNQQDSAGVGVGLDTMRKYTLFNEFIRFVNAITNYISKLENVVLDDPGENQVIKYVTETLRNIKNMIYDFVTMKFEISSYIAARTFFDEMYVAVQISLNMLSKIHNFKTENKDKETKKNKK